MRQTYSLTEQAIKLLDDHAKKTGLKKSTILEQLIKTLPTKKGLSFAKEIT